LARDIANEHLRNGIVRSTFITETEGQRYQSLQEQQRKVGYLRIPHQRYFEQITVSDAEISAFYEQYADEFRTPEEVSVDYIELNLADLAKQFDISDAEVRDYYEQHQENYVSQQEQRKVRHILVKVDADVDDQAARKQIESLVTRVQNGEDFAAIAKVESQDPGSASQGGDLGFISLGIMDKAFEQAAFQLAQNQLSQPIRTRFGYHLIEVTDIKPVELAPFDEVKAQIRKDLQTQQAEQRFYEEVDKLNNLSYEIPDSLIPVAEQLGLQVKSLARLSARKSCSRIATVNCSKFLIPMSSFCICGNTRQRRNVPWMKSENLLRAVSNNNKRGKWLTRMPRRP
jgi:peptidyl-prolyl cis-trans isomerase D